MFEEEHLYEYSIETVPVTEDGTLLLEYTEVFEDFGDKKDALETFNNLTWDEATWGLGDFYGVCVILKENHYIGMYLDKTNILKVRTFKG